MTKKILIPTDFSKNAWNAITFATSLFKNQNCVFYLMNSYSINEFDIGDIKASEFGVTSIDKANNLSKQELKKTLETLKSLNPDVKHTFKTISEYGAPIDVMKSTISKKDLELVIMGTKGRNNHSGTFFGSNTVTAMEEIRNCPVLGVPMDVKLGTLNEIVFPTNYEDSYKKRELAQLVQIAIKHESEICVLYVDPQKELSANQKANMEVLSECLEGSKFSFHHLSSTNRSLAVRSFVESRESKLVAMVNRKHGFFEKIFTTPMVKDLGMFDKVPLLVMHNLRN
ncbi:universal stress protein [Nonlabens sp. Ci31]|uniref:universal stress protein n=1 Tax=Nonlabens sp. Ci31 TaxID=2608253 RepID=UPI001463D3CF|nr:universal stress protein [Nonlabens sp. Ci31]QJP35665.1 universal stress protein [Nonlabens sp. Ci31]